jgi:anti-anti-sigma factor
MATNASKSQITFWSSTLIDFQTKEVTDSLTIVKLSGKLNEVTRSYFFQCIGDTLDGGCKQVVVDCNGLGMLGSAGLASLMLARKHARKKGGRIFLTHVNSVIADVLAKTNLNKLLAIYPSTASLLDTIKKGELANS